MAATKFIKIDSSSLVNADMCYRLKGNVVSFVSNRESIWIHLKRKGKEQITLGFVAKATVDEVGLIQSLRTSLLAQIPNHRLDVLAKPFENAMSSKRFRDTLTCIETIGMGKEFIKTTVKPKR